MAQMADSAKAIGIDLGVTYDRVIVWQNDRVEVIARDERNQPTPSYVVFTEAERLVRDATKNQTAMKLAQHCVRRKTVSSAVDSPMLNFSLV
jgi:molecular chaperone DnaK (HSP70)